MATGDAAAREAALVARANRGDREALETLYRDHRDWVVALAARFTHNHDDALDVLQETFIYFFGKFPGFRLSSTVRSFLYPVVKHQSISALRRRKVVDLAAIRAGEELTWHLPAPELDGDFARRLTRLPLEQREVVWLRFGLDFHLEEIAGALAIPLGTVKSRLHNALKALRNEPQ